MTGVYVEALVCVAAALYATLRVQRARAEGTHPRPTHRGTHDEAAAAGSVLRRRRRRDGYARAGFDVTGVDLAPQPRYPFPFVQADAMTFDLAGYDVIHASPPCPHYSTITPDRAAHPDLVAATRARLAGTGAMWVIENVPGAPLLDPMLLCGAAFGLGATCLDGRRRPLRRHRLFESNTWLMSAGCACHGEAIGVYGDGGGGSSTRPSGGGGYKAHPAEARAAMGIDWMNRGELSQAIPPAYTQHIGEQLAAHIGAAA